MPIRRPSASAGHPPPAHSSFRAHRSNDSHHALGNGLTQPPSIAYSAASATPQQKNVQALINRIKNKVRLLHAFCPFLPISLSLSCLSTLVSPWTWSRAIQQPKVPSMPLSSLHMIPSISLPGPSASSSNDSQRSVTSTPIHTPILRSPTRRTASRRRWSDDHRSAPIPVIRSQDPICVHVFQMEPSPRRPSSIRFTCKQTKLNLRTGNRNIYPFIRYMAL